LTRGVHPGVQRRSLSDDGDSRRGGADGRGGATPASVFERCTARERQHAAPAALSSRCGAPGRLLVGGEVAAAQTADGGQARVSGGGRAQALGQLGFPARVAALYMGSRPCLVVACTPRKAARRGSRSGAAGTRAGVQFRHGEEDEVDERGPHVSD
jgi:hypothetical protein